MRFILHIDLDNAAWRNDDELIVTETIGDSLSEVRKALWSGCESGIIRNTHGNKSGEWSITE